MISLKCKNCGGEMSVDLKGELACPYCGTKSYFSDTEFRNYKQFRLNMLQYLRAAADIADNSSDGSFLWTYHENALFCSDAGARIAVDYLFFSEEDGVESYVAKDTVVYVFQNKDIAKADRMLSTLRMLDYPSADLKGLAKYFPTIRADIRLDDGGRLIAVSKPENAYPLYAFGSLRPEHTAWIVSRLENICCVLEYSELAHCGISINSVFINPRTHEAFLFGGWWNAVRKYSRDQKDLYAVREVAGRVMGEYRSSAPTEFRRFLTGNPAEDAYSDFSLWDTVIEKGFGGHKFTKFSND